MIRFLDMNKIALLFLIAASFLIPDVMAADNPLGDVTLVPGTTGTSDLSGMMKFIVTFIGLAFFIIFVMFGFGDAIISIFSGLRDARSRGEWGEFVKLLMFVLIGVGFLIFIGSMMFTLLDKVGPLWTELMG